MLLDVQIMAQHNEPSQWHTPLARPGCWPTPDALEVGCTRQGTLGRNFTEARSHFGLWSVTSSPLILGVDLRDKDAVDFAWPIITNKKALAVNRAPVVAGVTGRRVGTDGYWAGGRVNNITRQIWAKNVTAASVAVLFVNAGDTPRTVTVGFDGMVPCMRGTDCAANPITPALCNVCRSPATSASERGLKMTVEDIWTGKMLPTVESGGELTVGPLAGHDSAFLLITKP